MRGIALRNTVGVIDADYRGEWIAHIVIDEQGENSWGDTIRFKRGDRAFQVLIVPFKKVDIELADKLKKLYIELYRLHDPKFRSNENQKII